MNSLTIGDEVFYSLLITISPLLMIKKQFLQLIKSFSLFFSHKRAKGGQFKICPLPN